MTANPFGGRLHHNIGAMLDGSHKVTPGTKGIIDHKRNLVLAGNGGNFLKIWNIEPWISDGFQIDGFGIGVNGCLIIIWLVGSYKLNLNAKPFELNLKLIVGATILK